MYKENNVYISDKELEAVVYEYLRSKKVMCKRSCDKDCIRIEFLEHGTIKCSWIDSYI